jgi:hypothetical protein
MLGIARRKKVNPRVLYEDISRGNLVLWGQIKNIPVAGKIVLRPESELTKKFPIEFNGVLITLIPYFDYRLQDALFVANNFQRISGDKELNCALSFDSVDKRVAAMGTLVSRLDIANNNFKSGRRTSDAKLSLDRGIHLFYNSDPLVNRRMIVAHGYVELEEEWRYSSAFFENGALLNNVPSWFEEVTDNCVYIENSASEVTRRGNRKKRNIDYSYVWRPDMKVKYFVKTDNKTKPASSIPEELGKFCLLPPVSAVEIAKDAEFIDDCSIGNAFFLNLPSSFCRRDYVMLGELK